MKKTSFCVVLITAPKGKEANRLSELLLKRRLCACVNIIKGVDSFFWWKGKIDRASESLMAIKTRQSLLPALIRVIKAAHSYDVCEVIALPIIAGSKEYLGWVNSSCRKG